MKKSSQKTGLVAVAAIGIFCGAWIMSAATMPPQRSSKAATKQSHAEQTAPSLVELQQQIQAQNERIDRLEQQQNIMSRVSRDAAASVALIVGEYIWTDPSGKKPLRYAGVDENGNYLRDQNGHELMSFDGTGAIVVGDFQSTGFLVDATHLLTSGFILSPWDSDPILDQSENPQVQPSIRMLHAYFPNVKSALDIKIDHAAESGDAVLCVIKGDVTAAGLQLSTSKDFQTGESIVMVGYPGGVDLLSSRVPNDVRREIYKFGPPNADEAAQVLAERGYIQPMVLPSRISGQTEDRIFFETFGNYGSTGAPLVNAQGQVVAMNQAVHPNYPSFSMGSLVAPLKAWMATAER